VTMFNGALALWGFFLVRFIWRFSFQGVGRGNPILLDSVCCRSAGEGS